MNLNFKTHDSIGSKEVESPLLCAVAKGCTKMLKLVLGNKSVDINELYGPCVIGDKGVNVFWIACSFGNAKIMWELAQAGIDVLCTNYRGTNALQLAVLRGFGYIVKMLLKSKFPIRNSTKDGFNAIHICAIKGNIEILNIFIDHLKLHSEEYLLKNLGIINEQWQMNALSLAIHHNHKDIAAVLIKNKIKLFNGQSDSLKDKSPIFMALNSSDSDLVEIMHANNQQELDESKNS